MATNLNEREKICPQCNTSFGCCTENCWCSSLPNIMTMPETGDCFCPKCLEGIIQEKINTTEGKKKLSFMPKNEMIENVDYYINEQGNWVFTAEYHLKRGYCCNSGCKNCPYGYHERKK